MAAFCACCGAEITLKPQACPGCGAPRHGMSPPLDLLPALDADSSRRSTLWRLAIQPPKMASENTSERDRLF
jgi:hypothetical protein